MKFRQQDLEQIRQIIREELTVELTWEKKTDEKTGQPLAVPEYKKEKVFLPAFLVQTINRQEGAFRGLQEDINKTNNKIDTMGTVVEQLRQAGQILFKIAETANQKGLVPNDLARQLRGNNEGSIER